MIEFHPGTKIPKSRCNAFDIPPKRQLKEPKPKVYKKRPSKVEQAARALETAEERAARITAFQKTYPNTGTFADVMAGAQK
jgi:hypothetical protein